MPGGWSLLQLFSRPTALHQQLGKNGSSSSGANWGRPLPGGQYKWFSPMGPASKGTYLAKTYWLQELVSKQELSIDRFAASDFFAETVKYKPKVDPTVEQRFRQANDLASPKAERD